MAELPNPFQVLDARLSRIEAQLEIIAGRESSRARDVDHPQFISVAEAARQMGVNRLTIYRAIEKNKIPWKKIGARKVIPISFLELLETDSKCR